MTLEEYAKEKAGNHRKFDSFVWFGSPEDDGNWAIIVPMHRDSTLVGQSNAHVIHEALAKFVESEDVSFEQHSHWAVGWVDAVCIRVYDKEGNITPAFKKMHELHEEMENYPLLDEEDHSEREYEASLENIKCEGQPVVDAPEDWPAQVYSWFNAQEDYEATESVDDMGAWPGREKVNKALDALGLLDPEVKAEMEAKEKEDKEKENEDAKRDDE